MNEFMVLWRASLRILGGGSDLFLSDAGITSVASVNVCGAMCVVEVLVDRASVVLGLTFGLDWLLLTPSWGSCASVRVMM